MDYINSRFVGFDDLAHIDAAAADLKLQKEKVLQLLESPELAHPSQERSLHAEGLVKAIRQLKRGKPRQVDALVDVNGDIAVLGNIRQLLESREALAGQVSQLEQAAQIEAAITQLAVDDPLNELYEQSRSLAEPQKSALLAQLDGHVARLHDSLASTLRDLLRRIRWLAPKETVAVAAPDFTELQKLVGQLVSLQAAQGAPQYPETWWALDCLVEPFCVRFDFHFEQAADTNKVSRPEWALSYVEKFLAQSLPQFELVLAGEFGIHNRIATYEVITLTLVPVREKILRMARSINLSVVATAEDADAQEKYGRLLSHLIFETTLFDQRLRSEYKYNPYISELAETPKRKWMGITADVLLSEPDAVSSWLDLENKLAHDRFRSEILGKDSPFDVDFEFHAAADSLKPSYSAFALVKLLNNLTSHFKTLLIVRYQLKYVSNIQLQLIDDYLNAVDREYRQVTESVRSKLISSVLTKKPDKPAVASHLSVGILTLQKLTGIYCLLRFVVLHMEEWSNDLLFVQLWDTYKELSAETGNDDSIFSAAIRQYNKLIDRVIERYEDFFKKEIRASFKEYVNLTEWTGQMDTKTQATPQLSGFVSLATNYLRFLQSALPELDYFFISSRVCDAYNHILHEYVITNNRYSVAGAKQLATDFEYLEDAIGDQVFLNPELVFSNSTNRARGRNIQLIDFLNKLDPHTVKVLKGNPDAIAALRDEFETGLDCLSDGDISDLLFRLV